MLEYAIFHRFLYFYILPISVHLLRLSLILIVLWSYAIYMRAFHRGPVFRRCWNRRNRFAET